MIFKPDLDVLLGRTGQVDFYDRRVVVLGDDIVRLPLTSQHAECIWRQDFLEAVPDLIKLAAIPPPAEICSIWSWRRLRKAIQKKHAQQSAGH